MEWSVLEILVLIGVAVAAGAINTVAGGGSNLVLPTLMLLGLPPEVANATNRVGILVESAVAVSEFKRHKRLPTTDLKAIVWPMAIGGLIGSLAAAFAPPEVLKPVLIGTMILMSAVVLVRPAVVNPPDGTAIKAVKDSPWAAVGLLAAGFYGGFIQAGVGFLLLAVIAGTLRYDIVRANAVKLVCTFVFTAVSLVVFVWQDQVHWVVGGVLSIGYVLGALVGVKLALVLQPSVLRWVLFVATLSVGVAAWVR